MNSDLTGSSFSFTRVTSTPPSTRYVHSAFAIAPETARRLVVAVRARDSRAARRWVIETIRTPAAILLADYARYVGEPAARPGYRREPAVGA